MTPRRNSKTLLLKTATVLLLKTVAAVLLLCGLTPMSKTVATEANRYSTTIFSKVAAVALTIKR